MPGDADPETQAKYLRSARAVRERCEAVHRYVQSGRSPYWRLDEARIAAAAEYVARVTRQAYPDVRAIPYHGRYRHFSAGGVNRLATLSPRLSALTLEERLMAEFELVITSVLLDAGAGPAWSYRDAEGHVYARSEGLAVASFDWFASGALSRDPVSGSLAVDTAVLENMTEEALARAFQVSNENPLVGLDGRVQLLRALGRAVRGAPAYFGEQPRLGHFALALVERARNGVLEAAALLECVLDAFGSIWPGRLTLGGRALGDVWLHSVLGHVPFHKLSQWLTYSLCEPLEAAGITIVELDALTGLAEYRNGGLFVDIGAIAPKDPEVLRIRQGVASELVVEWRALTVALLDRVAEELRSRLGLTRQELPLARVLEGGTWRAGRALAAEKRASGGPPLSIDSDGTVF